MNSKNNRQICNLLGGFATILAGTALNAAAQADPAVGSESMQVSSRRSPSGPSEAGDKPLTSFSGGDALGDIGFRVGVGYEIMYDSNIYISNPSITPKVDDVVHTVAPWVSLANASGRPGILKLSYAPRLVFFSKNSNSDTTEHEADFLVGYNFSKTSVTLGQTYSRSTDALADAGGRTPRSIYHTTLAATHEVSDKTGLAADAHFVVNDFDVLVSSRQYYGGATLDYEVAPKTRLGIRVGGGVDDVKGFNDSVYEQVQGVAKWSATGKLTVLANAGVEFRQFDDNGAIAGRNNLVAPVVGLGVRWAAAPGTDIGLNAERRVRISNTSGGSYTEDSTVAANVSQVLCEHWKASLTGGYTYSEFDSYIAGITQNRLDKYFFISPELGWRYGHLSGAFFYRFLNNESNFAPVDYQTHQAGARISYSF